MIKINLAEKITETHAHNLYEFMNGMLNSMKCDMLIFVFAFRMKTKVDKWRAKTKRIRWNAIKQNEYNFKINETIAKQNGDK